MARTSPEVLEVTQVYDRSLGWNGRSLNSVVARSNRTVVDSKRTPNLDIYSCKRSAAKNTVAA